MESQLSKDGMSRHSKYQGLSAIRKNKLDGTPLPPWVQRCLAEDPRCFDKEKRLVDKAKRLADYIIASGGVLPSKSKGKEVQNLLTFFYKTMRSWPLELDPGDERYEAIKVIEAVLPDWRGKSKWSCL